MPRYFLSACEISLVWRRIVESDKPVFTLSFGGTAVFAKGISEVAKHL
jgi:hypothetical protein